MRAKSGRPGSDTSNLEVTDISRQGFRLRIDGRELFLAFEDFPWFRGASSSKIRHVERVNEDHLSWPDLDVDLSVESIEHPERFPLVWRA